MKTTFYTLKLDQLRYSQVWEDSYVIENILEIGPEDEVLVITSGGINVFNSLLFDPKKIFAIDLNPLQNEFLALQIFIIQHFEVDDYLSAMGYKGKDQYLEIKAIIEQHATTSQWKKWAGFFESSDEGLSLSGKLESYITSFYDTLTAKAKNLLKELFDSEDLAAQNNKLQALLHLGFDQQFTDYFDRANLSKGRDIGLYQHTASTGGELFFQRFLTFSQSHLLKYNFIANFFFFGPQSDREAIIPRFCRGNNFNTVKLRLNRIETVNSEAIDFLLSEKGKDVRKAVLSNIFEYVSREEFKNAIFSLKERHVQKLRLLFWNLLNDQGQNEIYDTFQDQGLNKKAESMESCFFFGSVRHFTL